MSDDVTGYERLQALWVATWVTPLQRSVQCWGHYWKRMLSMQQDLLKQPVVFQKRTRTEIAKGPSFLDKYGRRVRDIDPERAV